jgi:hypothetical protein
MKEEFDVEKWRVENPVDYIKMFNFINDLQTPLEKDYVFNEFIRISKLYLPTTLYKYYSLNDDNKLNEIKIETVKNRKVYMAKISELNDPFDSRAFYYDSNRLKSISKLEEHGGRIIDDFTSYSRISAFTANGVNSMPMWAHYANNHSGFCVSYNMNNPDNLALRSCTFPIQYSDKRFDVTDIMYDQAIKIDSLINDNLSKNEYIHIFEDKTIVFLILLLCNIKHLTWNYEKEFRCTIGKTKDTENGNPYTAAIPEAIYVGMNCSEYNKLQLSKIANFLSIPLYIMIFNELSSDYSLVPKEYIYK